MRVDCVGGLASLLTVRGGGSAMKRDAILRLLPAVFQRTARPGTPLVALLDAMEALHAPAEEALGCWDATLDPRRTADAFVPYLARWVDLEDLLERSPTGAAREPFAPGLGRLRELIAAAPALARLRGTAKGLLLFLETATGVRGFTVEESVLGPDGQPLPFHVRLHAPAATAPYRSLIVRIIDREKPAFVTYEMTFDPPTEGV